MVVSATERNLGKENREYGVACNQEGLSDKVVLEKGLKEVREQIRFNGYLGK